MPIKKKLIWLEEDLYERVRKYRFNREIESVNAAIQRLLDIGLRKESIIDELPDHEDSRK